MSTKIQALKEQIEKGIDAKLNILLEGIHGTAKTSIPVGICQEREIKYKYFSSPTLDPFIDIVGLPVPTIDQAGNKTIEFHRRRDVVEAEVVIFDEISRAHMKTTNAMLEMIQFHTINGELMPHLRSVIAMTNPSGGSYQVYEMDIALVSRFHMHLIFPNEPDMNWFTKKFDELGKLLVDWWVNDLDARQQSIMVPRKLEHCGNLIQADLPPDITVNNQACTIPFELLVKRINAKRGEIEIADVIADPIKYIKLIKTNVNVQMRLMKLTQGMCRSELAKTRDVILAMPVEFLTSLYKDTNFVNKCVEGVREHINSSEAAKFKRSWQNKIKV